MRHWVGQRASAVQIEEGKSEDYGPKRIAWGSQDVQDHSMCIHVYTMYLYIYIHICIYIYTYVSIYIYIDTYVYLCVCACTYTHTVDWFSVAYSSCGKLPRLRPSISNQPLFQWLVILALDPLPDPRPGWWWRRLETIPTWHLASTMAADMAGAVSELACFLICYFCCKPQGNWAIGPASIHGVYASMRCI